MASATEFRSQAVQSTLTSEMDQANGFYGTDACCILSRFTLSLIIAETFITFGPCFFISVDRRWTER